MNQQTILQSNLLDIIFENRNKDYGAYTLRKFYQGRLNVAVVSTVGLAMILSLFLLYGKTPVDFKPLRPATFLPGIQLSNVNGNSQQASKKITLPHPLVKKIPQPERPPRIVTSDNINNLPATPAEIHPSLTGVIGEELNFMPGDVGAGGDNLKENTIAPVIKPAEEAETAPVAVAEIMPQYPGGIPALLSFLKKNIHSPGDVEEGADKIVEIEFVVNYNGNLESFVVVKSGGEIFDNEVVRVLKKMPLWIPGKSKGKNISVYYRVPVKFTGEF